MKIWSKPKIVVSKCLNNYPCRYNGESSNSKFLTRLKPFVKIYEICPEEGIGLPTPRNAIRLINEDNKIKLLDSKTFKEYTSLMVEFANDSSINIRNYNPNGFILKTRSPTCGVKDVKIYNGTAKGSSSSKGKGLFTSIIMDKFPKIPIEDDGRLYNFILREQFLSKIFLLSSFDDIYENFSLKDLYEYHNNNKLLLMTYSENGFKRLEKILYNHNIVNIKITYDLYYDELLRVISKSPSYKSLLNVFSSTFNKFSNNLSIKEKDFFFENLERFKNGKLPQCTINTLLKSYSIRFSDKNLLSQTIFEPFPIDLMDISDSGKGIVKD